MVPVQVALPNGAHLGLADRIYFSTHKIHLHKTITCFTRHRRFRTCTLYPVCHHRHFFALLPALFWHNLILLSAKRSKRSAAIVHFIIHQTIRSLAFALTIPFLRCFTYQIVHGLLGWAHALVDGVVDAPWLGAIWDELLDYFGCKGARALCRRLGVGKEGTGSDGMVGQIGSWSR